MRWDPAVAELSTMRLRVTHARRAAAIATAALASLVAVLLVAAGSSGSSRAALLSQLERPAVFPRAQVGPGPVRAVLAAGPYAVDLRIGPNHAPAHNTVSVRLTRDGRRVGGARVTLSYSMPAMDMGDVLTNALPDRAGGVYSIREPVLGMPGVWVLRFRVQPATGGPFTVTVSDLLR